ncbi:MAG TPA: hypothetical protein VJR02_28820 [Pyrinomonadaceae bacterium]|nr:hypothetical protein [Pyrinomonadaceae bacterium]
MSGENDKNSKFKLEIHRLLHQLADSADEDVKWLAGGIHSTLTLVGNMTLEEEQRADIYQRLLETGRLLNAHNIEGAINEFYPLVAMVRKATPLVFISQSPEGTKLKRIATTFTVQDVDLKQLKRDALYFDNFAFWNSKKVINDSPELSWLQEQEVVISCDHDLAFKIALNRVMSATNRGPIRIDLPNEAGLFQLMGSIKRLAAEAVSNVDNCIGIPWYDSRQEFNSSFLEGTEPCLAVILKALPTPNDHTPWESIIDFRRDPDSIRTRAALLNWQNKILKDNKNPNELADEIEYLISEYEEHLKLHKIKYSQTGAELLITGAAEIIDDVVHLKFKSLAEKLFAFKQRRLALREAELSAPGKEVAYISLAKDRFL